MKSIAIALLFLGAYPAIGGDGISIDTKEFTRKGIQTPETKVQFDFEEERYSRNGQVGVILREVTTSLWTKDSGDLPKSKEKVLAFICSGREILSFRVKDCSLLSCRSPWPIWFAISNHIPKKEQTGHYIHIAVPEKDYYEYVEFTFSGELTFADLKTYEGMRKSTTKIAIEELKATESIEKSGGKQGAGDP